MFENRQEIGQRYHSDLDRCWVVSKIEVLWPKGETVIESHAYSWTSRTSHPSKLYELLKIFLDKDFNSNDLGKTCVFRTKDFTINLTLTSGKLMIYTDFHINETKSGLKKIINDESIANEIIDNMEFNKKDIRNHKGLNTKSGYSEDHIYGNEIPSPSLNLQKMPSLNSEEIGVLRYIYRIHAIDAKSVSQIFSFNYSKSKRMLEKLYTILLVERIDKSPALYDKVSNIDRSFLISQFIGFWNRLFSG